MSWQRCDLDRDGKLDYQEFKAMIFRSRERKEAALQAEVCSVLSAHYVVIVQLIFPFQTAKGNRKVSIGKKKKKAQCKAKDKKDKKKSTKKKK